MMFDGVCMCLLVILWHLPSDSLTKPPAPWVELGPGESKDPGHEHMERVVQRLRHAHSATLDAMERAGRQGQL